MRNFDSAPPKKMETIINKGTKLGAGALVAVFGIMAVSQSYFTVQPSEVANVRRFNSVLHAQPLERGTYFKLPFGIDKVDRAQISLRTLHINPFIVNTIDNQQITLDINFNYVLPKNQVNHVLYEVGSVEDSHNDDIDDSIIPVAMDRAARVFAQQNTTNISLDREKIQAKVEADVSKAVEELFGIEPRSLQFAAVTYSDAFVASNNLAVTNKNLALAELNKKKVEEAKAGQVLAEAKGVADSAIATAKGNKASIILKATADAQARALEGEGQAERLRKEIAPFKTPQAYITYLQRKAELQWNGQRPQVEVAGGADGKGGQTAVVIPVPALRP